MYGKYSSLGSFFSILKKKRLTISLLRNAVSCKIIHVVLGSFYQTIVHQKSVLFILTVANETAPIQPGDRD